eukprot:scaffold61947_cov63-Attheya_sp.AAC.7
MAASALSFCSFCHCLLMLSFTRSVMFFIVIVVGLHTNEDVWRSVTQTNHASAAVLLLNPSAVQMPTSYGFHTNVSDQKMTEIPDAAANNQQCEDFLNKLDIQLCIVGSTLPLSIP